MAKLDLSPSHALYVLEQAYEDRKITRADVDHYIKKMHDEVAEIQQRLAQLRAAMEDAGTATLKMLGRKMSRATGKQMKKTRRVRRKVVSAARLASQQLQGQYLGYMRQIAKARRSFFKRLSKSEGREKAVAAMKKALGK